MSTLRLTHVDRQGEGTFSEVIKAQAIKNGRMVAIKCMKSHFESEDQVRAALLFCSRHCVCYPIHTRTLIPCLQVNNLREIQALRRLSPHPNIIKLLEVLYDQPTGRLALVFELMDMNIYELIRYVTWALARQSRGVH